MDLVCLLRVWAQHFSFDFIAFHFYSSGCNVSEKERWKVKEICVSERSETSFTKLSISRDSFMLSISFTTKRLWRWSSEVSWPTIKLNLCFAVSYYVLCLNKDCADTNWEYMSDFCVLKTHWSWLRVSPKCVWCLRQPEALLLLFLSSHALIIISFH